MPCSRCGHDNPNKAKFCSECGASLVGAPAARRRGEAEGERRHLTVMFVDLVGSTALAERLDPEDLHEVIHAYQETSGRVVARYEGYVAQYLGDGLLVYFGYPRAHEDDAQRATRAALGIIEEVGLLSDRLEPSRGARLHVRIGIHSGPIVVGDVGTPEQREKQVFGRTINLAARLQGIAGNDSVLISADTLRLVEGLFRTESLGKVSLKGIADPVEAFQVLQPSGVRSRLDVAAAWGLTPLVGREQEIDLLLDHFEAAGEGDGRAVLLCGEAGIGKSRLLQALRERLPQGVPVWLECHCSAYARDSAFYPVIELQRQSLGFDPEDDAPARLAKLATALDDAGFDPKELLPLFAALHSLPVPEDYPAAQLSSEGRRRKTLAALVEWVVRLGGQRPVVLLIEDLHWVDPSTAELLGLLLERIASSRVLALLTFRPDFTPPWPTRDHVSRMLLNRLTRSQVLQLVDDATRERQLAPEWVAEIVRKADGVPLFAEELARTVIESLAQENAKRGDPAGPRIAIPATLHDSLLARLDQLGRAKELAQFCATLGREFSYELLRETSPLDEISLRAQLAELVASELFYQRGIHPHATYLFKHALIRDAAYESLRRARRRQFHQRIGESIEKRFPEIAETQPELLAHHFTEAALVETAIGYWGRAGERAIQRSANLEAAGHLARGLDLLSGLPESRGRSEQELALRTHLGLAQIAALGYGAEEVKRTFARAQELCRELGETPQLFPVLYGLWLFHLVRSDKKDSAELADTLHRFGQRSGDAGFDLLGHGAKGVTAFWRGEQLTAIENLDRSIALYDPDNHGSFAFIFGQDPRAYGQAYAALSLWFLGYPDQALARSQEGLALAERLQHPFTTAGVVNLSSQLHRLRREAGPFRELAERLVAISTEQGFPFWVEAGLCFLGEAKVQSGAVDEGIAQIQERLPSYRAIGTLVNLAYILAYLAEAQLGAGRVREGLESVTEGLMLAETNLDRYYEAELYRLRGELLLATSERDEAAAEASLERALEVARAQSARSLELRAAMSLYRMMRGRSGESDARQRLAGVFGWFREGFETADLREAHALLQETG